MKYFSSMPRLKSETIALKRQKLIKTFIENNFSTKKVAEVLGVKAPTIDGHLKRYGIRDELLKISERLGFGNEQAMRVHLRHIKRGSLRALDMWYDRTQPIEKERDIPTNEINIEKINIITSKAVEEAMKKFQAIEV